MPQTLQFLLIFGVIAASLTVWFAVFVRLVRGLPILPYQPRRPVPWTVLDVVVLLFAYLYLSMLLSAAVAGVDALLVQPPSNETSVVDAGLSGHAPAGDRADAPPSDSDKSTSPGVASSAKENDDSASVRLDFVYDKRALVLDITAKVLICGFAVFWFVSFRKATCRDLGIVVSEIPRDILLGLAAYLALIPPVYLIQYLMTRITPTRHPLITALEESNDVGLLILSGIAAVIIAPVVEEFGFRLMIQGWLESLIGPGSAATEPGPIPADDDEGAVAGTDSHEHATIAEPPVDVTKTNDAEHISHPDPAPASGVGADKESTRTVWTPIIFSSLFFLAPHALHGPDVVALALLAVGLGYLYQRTHRILPCIVVHFGLNATSMWQMWSAFGQ